VSDLGQYWKPIYKFDLIAKGHFKHGPWLEEPDRVEWIFHDLVCLVLRHDKGYLQGFVGVSWGRPLWGLEVQDITRRGISAHRGLTYAAQAQTLPLSSASPYAGDIRTHFARSPFDSVEDPALFWFFGFHCNHQPAPELPGDFAPEETLTGERPSSTHAYRTFVYTADKVDLLAHQLRNEILKHGQPADSVVRRPASPSDLITAISGCEDTKR
jgi:hypothetical protein